MIEKLNILKWFRPRKPKVHAQTVAEVFRAKYSWFKELLSSNTELLNVVTEIEEVLQGRQVFGMSFVRAKSTRAVFHTFRMVKCLNSLSDNKYFALYRILEQIHEKIREHLAIKQECPVTEFVLSYSRVTKNMVDWVGGKNANLGEVQSRVGLPIPAGFAITTHAYRSFLAHNDLVDEINKRRMEINPDDVETANRVSEEIQRRFLSAKVPKDLEVAILSAYSQMAQTVDTARPGNGPLKVSMRSSAVGEDSELSYAGQYVSSLNVPPDRMVQTYKYILASLYTPRALTYRLNKGIRDEDIAMGVACLEMVHSIASGVAYSRHPFDLRDDHIVMTAVWGLGPYAVDGTVSPDSYRVAKDASFTILETDIAHKPVQLVSNPEGGGLVQQVVPAEKQNVACLTEGLIRTLAQYTLQLEEHFRCPQDVEWALNASGQVLILQSRPLRVETFAGKDLKLTGDPLPGYPLLIEKGAIACPGVGCGPAYHVHSEQNLAGFPDGAVLVAEHSSPRFVLVMGKAQAILTDSGSVTGHMASLAREFKVPSILDAKVATTAIPEGVEVTVDAYSGRVYQGRVPELLATRTHREPHMKETPVYKTLRQVAELIVPLHLVDPEAPSFVPQSCETLHDIMRLVHEASYLEMFQISDLVSIKGGGAVKLDVPLPIDLYIIDLEGGLRGVPQGARKVTMDDIASLPFKALLKGMTHEALRVREPRPIELKGLFSVLSQQMLAPPPATQERFGDRSYAIISDKYLNFSSRVGYHYSVVDAYCGETINKNYITFSFKGGAADDTRRHRRARAISGMLKANGFSVEVTGDRVQARFQKYERPLIEERLDVVGRLLQFTRQMDMLMSSEASVEAVTNAFLEENYGLEKKS